MKRRKFIIGVGALTAGGAAAVGTGAYSAAEMDREANINVVNDAQGLVALLAGGDPAVEQSESGELTIDIDPGDDDAGVNVNSRYQIGYPKGHIDAELVSDAPDGKAFPEYELSEAAFQVVNQDTVAHEITLEYEAEDPGGSVIWFEPTPSNGTNQENIRVDGDNNPDSATHTIGPGVTLGVAILIDTREGSTDDDLSGTLTVSAN